VVYRVRLSRRARRHLEAIKVWSYEHHRTTSREFIRGLLYRIRQLRDNPELGPVFEEPYRQLSYEPYQVFYVIHARPRSRLTKSPCSLDEVF
jgi:plasmid stabilization system protein ParE